MPNSATPQPEPGSVMLPLWAVAKLREYLARADDYDCATAEERAEARTELCGFLAGCLDPSADS